MVGILEDQPSNRLEFEVRVTLKELAQTRVTTEKGSRSLLKEVDVISSVSGGSFTSAYYAL